MVKSIAFYYIPTFNFEFPLIYINCSQHCGHLFHFFVQCIPQHLCSSKRVTPECELMAVASITPPAADKSAEPLSHADIFTRSPRCPACPACPVWPVCPPAIISLPSVSSDHSRAAAAPAAAASDTEAAATPCPAWLAPGFGFGFRFAVVVALASLVLARFSPRGTCIVYAVVAGRNIKFWLFTWGGYQTAGMGSCHMCGRLSPRFLMAQGAGGCLQGSGALFQRVHSSFHFLASLASLKLSHESLLFLLCLLLSNIAFLENSPFSRLPWPSQSDKMNWLPSDLNHGQFRPCRYQFG